MDPNNYHNYAFTPDFDAFPHPQPHQPQSVGDGGSYDPNCAHHYDQYPIPWDMNVPAVSQPHNHYGLMPSGTNTSHSELVFDPYGHNHPGATASSLIGFGMPTGYEGYNPYLGETGHNPYFPDARALQDPHSFAPPGIPLPNHSTHGDLPELPRLSTPERGALMERLQTEQLRKPLNPKKKRRAPRSKRVGEVRILRGVPIVLGGRRQQLRHGTELPEHKAQRKRWEQHGNPEDQWIHENPEAIYHVHQ